MIANVVCVEFWIDSGFQMVPSATSRSHNTLRRGGRVECHSDAVRVFCESRDVAQVRRVECVCFKDVRQVQMLFVSRWLSMGSKAPIQTYLFQKLRYPTSYFENLRFYAARIHNGSSDILKLVQMACVLACVAC